MITAQCIGCGCQESAACPFDATQVADTCWWLRLDVDHAAGVCSSCEDLVPHWTRGGRVLLPDIVVERFHRQAMFLYNDEASAKAWINTPQPALDGKSPRGLILSGQIERVRQLLDQLRSGAFA